MNSAFTPAGTSQAEGQQNRNSGAAGYAYNLLPGQSQYEKMQQGYQMQDAPQTQNAWNQLAGFTTQGGRNQLVNSYGQQQQGMAQGNAANADSMFAGNHGLAQGYQLDQMNQANTNTANYQNEINSPQYLQQAYQALAGTQPTANYQGLNSLLQGVYGQPNVPVGQGLGGFLGSAASSWAGSGFKTGGK